MDNACAGKKARGGGRGRDPEHLLGEEGPGPLPRISDQKNFDIFHGREFQKSKALSLTLYYYLTFAGQLPLPQGLAFRLSHIQAWSFAHLYVLGEKYPGPETGAAG